MNARQIKRLAAQFSVNRLDTSRIARKHKLYGGYMAFAVRGETVIHCRFDQKNMRVTLSGGQFPWGEWESGDIATAIGVALTGCRTGLITGLTKTVRMVGGLSRK